MEEFFTIEEKTTAKIVEKRSKFIADIFPVCSVKEAEEKIIEIRKKYFDAKHHCFAYRVIENNQIIEKSSDDGEPSGTAGAPMLAILQKQNLSQILVVVTRYFGGTLLGTGGLVKAYSEATIQSIDKAKILQMQKGWEIEIELPYSELKLFSYYCKNKDISIINTIYLDVVICKIEMENKVKNELLRDVETKNIKINNLKVLSEKYITKSV